MKVKDILEALKELDPEATLIISSSNPEKNGDLIEATSLFATKEAKLSMRQYRDMMDGETFESPYYQTKGGNESIVWII